MGSQNPWLALMIGNSRLHWAYFNGNILVQTWATGHGAEPDLQQLPISQRSATGCTLGKAPLVLASVVPGQTKNWLTYQPRILTLGNLPLGNLYPTFGIDRALAGLGTGLTYGFPCLVIDGGTALTITGFDQRRNLLGGAILPGLGLQLNTLGDRLAALPSLDLSSLPENLPERWALDTQSAIFSGVVYGILGALQSYLKDWQRRFPGSAMVITGGDGAILHKLIQVYLPHLKLEINENLIFLGMANFCPGDPCCNSRGQC